MRKALLIVFVMLLAVPVVTAQEEDECIEYIEARKALHDEVLAAFDVLEADDNVTNGVLLAQALWEERDGLMAMDVPECGQELHELSIQRTILQSDALSLLIFSRADLVNGRDHAFASGSLQGDIEDLNEAIDAIFESNPAWLAIVEPEEESSE